MRNIILPNKELRLLSNQLQNFNSGFTVQQIRSLDVVIRNMNMVLKPFTDKLDEILKVITTNVDKKKEQEAIDKKQSDIEQLIKTDGEKIVTLPVEDQEYQFIKDIWSKIGTFNGSPEARTAIIKIDDAITKATEPVFDNHEDKN